MTSPSGKQVGTRAIFEKHARMAEQQDTDREKRRALVQFVLGLLQLSGATAGVILLLTTGPSGWTITVVALTLCISVLSRTWFPRRKPPR